MGRDLRVRVGPTGDDHGPIGLSLGCVSCPPGPPGLGPKLRTEVLEDRGSRKGIPRGSDPVLPTWDMRGLGLQGPRQGSEGPHRSTGRQGASVPPYSVGPPSSTCIVVDDTGST